MLRYQEVGQLRHVLGWKGTCRLQSLLPKSINGMLRYPQIVSLTAQSGTNFSAAAEVHPAMGMYFLKCFLSLGAVL